MIENDFEFYIQLGDLFFDDGKYVDAVVCYKKAINNRNNIPSSKIYTAKIKLKNAIDISRKVKKNEFKICQEEFIKLIRLGDHFSDLKRYEDSIKCYRSAAKYEENLTRREKNIIEDRVKASMDKLTWKKNINNNRLPPTLGEILEEEWDYSKIK